MEGGATLSQPATTERIEQLGRIIMAYSEVTEKLQLSHERLERTVLSLQSELSEKNRLLERRNRLAALGEMAAGMAHEIRNPLGGIRLYASMLARDLHDRPDSALLVQKMVFGVKRLEELVSSVLQFTREMRISPVRTSLRQIIQEAMDLAASAMQNGDVTGQVNGPEELEVDIDPLLMGQAILNLLLNATEAMPGGGQVTIEYGLKQEHPGRSVADRPAGETTMLASAADAPGQISPQMLEIVVQDNGQGIPPEIIERIFNPFFTTRDTGTGLGLAIVHRIIESHNGTITVMNVDGGGARFVIRMPAVQAGPMV